MITGFDTFVFDETGFDGDTGESPPPPIDPWLWPTSPVPLQRPATPIGVYRYIPPGTAGTPGTYDLLDNVECLGIEQAMGIDPGRAHLRYRFTGLDEEAPQSIEDALGSNGTPPEKTIDVGWQIVVKATQPDEETQEIVFWGTPVLFGMKLAPAIEGVEITCVGIAKEAWNTPVGGLLIRQSSNIATGKDFQTDIPAQFNPKGKANATPLGSMVNADTGGSNDYKYPTFMDPNVVVTGQEQRTWTLAMAARYLIYTYLATNPTTDLTFPEGSTLDDLLVSREPISGVGFDPTDPETYTVKDIDTIDRPITGRDWPSLLNDFIRDKGFGMDWLFGTDEDTGNPTCTLEIYLIQAVTTKDVYLQLRGDNLDPEQSNINEAAVHRDINQVVNQWEVKGALERYEVSLILKPGFPMFDDDAGAEQLAKFDRSSDEWATNIDTYRLFIYDEAGEGTYANGTSVAEDVVGNLDVILGAPDEEGNPVYSTRRRRPIGKVLQEDAAGEPLNYSVAISTDYTGEQQEAWNRTGHWQTVSGGVELLPNRIGIRVTAINPNAWKIGKCEDESAPFPAGVCNLVDFLAGGGTGLFVRLTCVIEGDNAVTGTAPKTTSSLLAETITRIVDARDRFQKTTQCMCSEHFDSTLYSDDQVLRDDTGPATSEAIACRVATESGVLDGQVTIPRFTRYYEIGDRIRQINGRNLGFRTDNATGGNDNAPIYPTIVAIRHDLAGKQKTYLTLSDQDGHRYKIEGKTKRK
jgi:hypothetical protein